VQLVSVSMVSLGNGGLLRAVARYLFSELGSPKSSVIHSPTVDKFINGFTRTLRAENVIGQCQCS
jgi:hypothetical protein